MSKRPRILHITNWLPNPWDSVEGNFVREQIKVFEKVAECQTANVQVRHHPKRILQFIHTKINDGEATGYYIITRFTSSRLKEWLTTLLLMIALIRERAWKFDVLHIHIAIPLLSSPKLVKLIWKKPIIVSEHWTAYHYNFFLTEGSPALERLRRPFQHHFPIIAVSEALLEDIRNFASPHKFNEYVIPNIVPLHGYRTTENSRPTLFIVNVWRRLKSPQSMLSGLDIATKKGAKFDLIIGGYGELLDEMKDFVSSCSLADRTRFLGKMTKAQIAEQLALSDGYIFSSEYETFSVACAEALGAGLPLIGPHISAIAEYAGPENWEVVERRDADAWCAATLRFVEKLQSGAFDQQKIADEAAARFSHERISSAYKNILDEVLVNR